jgi:hypothetical protein
MPSSGNLEDGRRDTERNREFLLQSSSRRLKCETPERSYLPGVAISPEFPNPEECHAMAINTLPHVLNCSKVKKIHRLLLSVHVISRRSPAAAQDKEAFHAL